MKKIIAFTLTICIILLFVSCGLKNLKTDYLKDIAEKNTLEYLLQSSDKLGYQIHYTYKDGTIESLYTYADRDGLNVLEYNGSVTVDDNGNCYGFDNDNKQMYSELFVADAYDEYVGASQSILLFYYAKNETIIEKTETEKAVFVKTDCTNVLGMTEQLQMLGYSKDDIKAIYCYHNLYKDSLEVYETVAEVVTKDGKAVQFLNGHKLKGVEKYKIDEQILNAMGGTDTKTITVNWKDIDGKFYKASKTVDKTTKVYINLPLGFEQQLYTDETYKTVYQQDKIINTDITLYAKEK